MKEAVQHGHRGIALKFGSIVASAHQPIYIIISEWVQTVDINYYGVYNYRSMNTYKHTSFFNKW